MRRVKLKPERVDEIFEAAEHPRDSQAPGESPTKMVASWARTTAGEMLAEHGSECEPDVTVVDFARHAM